MRVRRGTGVVLLAALLAGGLVSTGSVAQPGKERREERREDRQDRREERREETKERREERREEAKERREDRKDARHERRDRRRSARRAFLDKWGPIHKRAPVRAELAVHARRMAHLAYMKTLTETAKKEELTKRIDAAITKEQARHQARMEAFKQETGGEQ